jgi:methylated-DNA-[protein]-cysteine S-methyltransferase
MTAATMNHILFPTAFGTCGISWGDTGITGFQLPEDTDARTEGRLAASGGLQRRDLAPEWVQRIIARVRLHLEGVPQDFSDVRLEWGQVSEFQRAVYAQTQRVGPGLTTSYGDIARALGLGPDSARAVGAALGSNPWPLLVPCHRVVSAAGRMTGFSAPGGVRTKTRLLALEGAELLSE